VFSWAARAPRRSAAAILFVILYTIGITLIPLAINPLPGGRLPYRALIAVPYVFWFLRRPRLIARSRSCAGSALLSS
jgi:hypothetical protein